MVMPLSDLFNAGAMIPVLSQRFQQFGPTTLGKAGV